MQSFLRFKFTRNRGTFLFLLAPMLLACSDGPASAAKNTVASKRATPATFTRTAEPYRIRADLQRNRYWVLGDDHVSVHDAVNRKLIRQIKLPGRNVADFVAYPDMVLDRTGAALVSSNITPMLWHIDPDSFNVTRIDIKLQTRENWDTGFSGLAYTADGALFGVTSFASSLWLLNISEAKATPIEPANPASNSMAITIPIAIPIAIPISIPHALRVAYQATPDATSIKPYLCIAGADRSIRIELSIDNRRARIVDTACNSD